MPFGNGPDLARYAQRFADPRRWSVGAKQVRDRAAGFLGRCVEVVERAADLAVTRAGQLKRFGGARDTPGADAAGRAFQRVRQGHDAVWRGSSHAGDQQGRLPVEQLKNFAFQVTVAKGGAGEVDEVDRPVVGRKCRRLGRIDFGRIFHQHSRPLYGPYPAASLLETGTGSAYAG